MRRKYLDDLGTGIRLDKIYPSNIFKRIFYFFSYKRQRTKYGFDVRETWEMDCCFFSWLYEHLMMYNEVTEEIIDKEEYTVCIDNETISLQQAINEMIEGSRIFLLKDMFDRTKKEQEKIDQALYLFSKTITFLWW